MSNHGLQLSLKVAQFFKFINSRTKIPIKQSLQEIKYIQCTYNRKALIAESLNDMCK